MRHIYSKTIVAERKSALIDAVKRLRTQGIAPKLAAVLCSNDPAVLSYVSTKRKHTEEVGALFELVDLGDSSGYADAARRTKDLCAREDVHGVILVMASNPVMDELALTNLIPAHKDVDGLSAASLGLLVQNDPRQIFTAPATPRACLLLAQSQTEIKGKRVVVIGRGRTVGKPLANMLINAGASVTVCHSASVDIPRLSRDAEIVFLATGRPHHFGKACFSDGQIIVDAGIGFIENRLAGDVAIDELAGLDVSVTPVPGGVGPLTSVLILENLLKLVEAQAASQSRG